jgi:hypothetical protein
MTGAAGVSSLQHEKSAIQVFPNPLQGPGWIRIEAGRSGTAMIRVTDLTGREVSCHNIVIPAGSSVHPFEPSNNLPDGLYLIQVSGVISARTKLFLRNKP